MRTSLILTELFPSRNIVFIKPLGLCPVCLCSPCPPLAELQYSDLMRLSISLFWTNTSLHMQREHSRLLQRLMILFIIDSAFNSSSVTVSRVQNDVFKCLVFSGWQFSIIYDEEKHLILIIIEKPKILSFLLVPLIFSTYESSREGESMCKLQDAS